MSGHSKWATIKHQKGITDKKRGTAFSKAVKIITLAVKEGKSTDPNSNFKLRLAMEKAKAINMPKDNIQRAIDRASGQSSDQAGLTEMMYEGFGPGQAALLVMCVTDNKNRTLSQVKNCFEKRGYSLGAPGSANYLFEKKGLIQVMKSNNPEDDQLKLMDLNPEDIQEGEDHFWLICMTTDLNRLVDEIKKLAYEVKDFKLTNLPKTPIELETNQKQNLLDFIEQLEDLEDVEMVYTNVRL
jgi:YebC/PmpR family DNA-binding regulatory protein